MHDFVEDGHLFEKFLHLLRKMDILDKIQILGDSAKYDLCGSYLCSSNPRIHGPFGKWIYPSVLPDGRTVSLLKILLSNDCLNNCLYCANRTNRSFQRIDFKEEELAKLFIEQWKKNLVEGLFLSSAVKDSPEITSEKMLKVVEMIRIKYKFKGYIHLKIIPGSSFSYVERAVELADRVSLNLEAPNIKRLKMIAPDKDFNKIINSLHWVSHLQKKKGILKAGFTTQFVVGASDEKDEEILKSTKWLYNNFELKRAYFSAFQPVDGTPLEEHSPTPLIREHRLYQVDFLFRYYNFKFEEIIFDSEGNLPLNMDPKMIWAFSHPEKFPIEINKANYEELIRIPGIGPKSAKRIIKYRKQNKFRTIEELKGTGCVLKRIHPFILIDGKLVKR